MKSNAAGVIYAAAIAAAAVFYMKEGRFARSLASSSRLRCSSFLLMYSSRDLLSDFCITIDTIHRTRTTPSAITIYVTTLLPPRCYAVL